MKGQIMEPRIYDELKYNAKVMKAIAEVAAGNESVRVHTIDIFLEFACPSLGVTITGHSAFSGSMWQAVKITSDPKTIPDWMRDNALDQAITKTAKAKPGLIKLMNYDLLGEVQEAVMRMIFDKAKPGDEELLKPYTEEK